MKTILVIFAVLLVLPCIALATPVPDTGQTISYYPGDDGYYAPRNPHSYTKLDANGNDLPDEAPWPWAMVRDNVTGLIWEVKTDDDSIHDKGNVYTWERAMGFGTTLNTEQFGGYSDWRLPTVKELSSLVDSSISYPGPTIDTIYFPNTHPYYYWSSTNLARNRYRAWYVHFDDGHIYDEITANLFSVRAVRGEQSSSFGHFIDNNDGTITNTDTGLMWQKTTAPGTYTWQQALYYCENFSLADYHDWRLPNRNELQSIVDYNRESPPIDPIFNDVGSYYWSSTTAAGYPIYAWGVSFGYDGHMGYGLKYHGGGYVRAVRGGQCGSLGDADGDTVCDDVDNCPSGYNLLQSDCDNDGEGDICDADTIDTDEDGLDVLCDNCPNHYNTKQEDADADGAGNICDNCPLTSNPGQEDSYPPQGNGIGDACDCEGNFNCDADVDGSDASTFKADFGRSVIENPCTSESSCKGDFNCDHDSDGTDVSLFKSDFGRSSMQSPCPTCEAGIIWCVYP